MSMLRLATLFAVVVTACSSSTSDGAAGAFAQPCGAGGACASGLVCAKGGFAPGLCTQTCKDSAKQRGKICKA
jgi:hypothetical protein